jgi:folate-binding protein YgfZ
VFEEEAGWLMPAHFGDEAVEYRNARDQTALFDVSHRGQVEVKGADAAKFLHNLCTNDVMGLAPGYGCEAFLPNAQAKIVAQVLIYHTRSSDGTDTWSLDAGPGMGLKVYQHLDRYLISEQVELADRTAEHVQLHLAGAEASAILKKIVGADLPELQRLQHTSRDIGIAGPCSIRRNDVLGLRGYDVVCPRVQAETLWKALTDAGARPAGLRAFHTLRIEAGMPIYGFDIDESNLPQEVGRTEDAISFTKGCYIGQETIARIRTYGHVNRSLVGLKIAGGIPATRGARLLRDGKEVGQVTSSVVSPRLGRVIALGYVRRGSEQAGTALEVATGEERRAAEVASLPFTGSSAGAA